MSSLRKRWDKIKEGFKLAFAVGYEEEITKEEEQLLEKIAKKIVKRRLSVPVIMILETFRPAGYISMQYLAFLEPYIKAIINIKEIDIFRKAIEKRKGIELLIKKIEFFESEMKLKTKELNNKDNWKEVGNGK